jgi:ribokinase
MTVETIDDAKKACKKLLELGSRIAIITMGDQGAVICNKEGEYEHVEIEKSSSVCDSTGAGDSFVGTLALLMARKENLPLKEQVKRACRVASQSVEKKGTQTSYPTNDELRFNLFE